MAAIERRAIVIALLLVPPAGATGDVLITEATSARIGGRAVQGVRSTYIKGARMRVEQVHGDQSSTTLFDVPAGAIIDLDSKKRRAEIREMRVRAAELERQYPRQRVSVTMAATGAMKELAGWSCPEYTFSITVPMTKDGDPAMTMSGSAWIGQGAPGADDYRTFAARADERQLVVGYASNNRIAMGITRGQTELYRALAGLGIPYQIDLTIRFDGHGLLSGLMNKVASGSRTSSVAKIAIEPIADDRFLVPDGWKREKK